mmetsp:Transcript_4354/g.18531  ORF Transcript_4354/g.18531 Transcript_4354/m.18531 type:complete len:317 (+) Transcript_4354:1126-2076(+)
MTNHGPPSRASSRLRSYASLVNDLLHALHLLAGHLGSPAPLPVAHRLDAARLVPLQLRWDGVVRALQERLQVVHDVRVLRGEERHGGSRAPRASGAPDAVRVVLDGERKLVVHNQVDVFHVDAAPGDVRRHEHVALASLEPAQSLLARVLRLAAVQRRHGVPQLGDARAHRVHRALRVDKHDGLRVRELTQGQLQVARLLLFRRPPHNLLDEVRGLARAADGHHRGVAQVLARETLHGGGHGRREHVRHAILGPEIRRALRRRRVERLRLLERLERVRGHAFHHGVHLRLETHVDHAVRLIKHDVVALLKHGVPAL